MALGSCVQIKIALISILILRQTIQGVVNHGHLELTHAVWAILTTLAARWERSARRECCDLAQASRRGGWKIKSDGK